MSASRAEFDASWLQRLSRRLDCRPAQPRSELRVAAGDRAGATIGSIESALALQLAAAGFALRDIGDAWCLEVPRASDIDPTLARIADWLRDHALASAWRNELLSVVDATAERVASVERAAVRPLGIATHAVHLVARDERGRVWVQQRAFDKATDPGQWDTTMGGLMAADESIAQTLERETWEEAGLRLEKLNEVEPFGRFTVRRPVERGYMVEHIEMFECVVPGAIVPVNQDGEVERFECLDRSALIERLHADAFTLEAAKILALWLQRRDRAQS